MSEPPTFSRGEDSDSAPSPDDDGEQAGEARSGDSANDGRLSTAAPEAGIAAADAERTAGDLGPARGLDSADVAGAPLPPRPPGSAIFSLEGRAAPGLYLVGWLATVLGLAVLIAVILSAPGGTGALVLVLVSTVLLSVGLIAAAGAQGMQRRANHAAYAGPSPFLVFAASVPISLPVAIVALRLAELAGVDPASPLGSVIGQSVLVLGLVLLVRLLVVGTRALSWAEMGVRWPGVASVVGDMAWGAVLAVPIILVTAALASVLVNLLGTTPDSPLPSTSEPTGIALNFLAAVVIAPIGEELFFRGFSLTAWERSLGWRNALIRASIFFAFVHILTVSGETFSEALSKAAIAFAIRLPVAFALGWVFLRRRSIFASIGLHAAFNGLLLLIAELALRQ